MSTGQKYSGKGNNVSPTPQTGQNTASTPSKSDDRFIESISAHLQSFITNNQDLVGQPFGTIEIELPKRLLKNPIRYTNVLDGLALVHAFTPKLGVVIDDHYSVPDCHYALLINQQGYFDQLIPVVEETEPDLNVEYMAATALSLPKMLETAADGKAGSVLIVSTRNENYDLFTSMELAHIYDMWEGTGVNGVKMLDWLIVTPNGNCSWEYQIDSLLGRNQSKEGVEWVALLEYGIDANEV